jgi:hypothetical protein
LTPEKTYHFKASVVARLLALLLLAVVLLQPHTLSAQTTPAKEFQIKAVFLFHFTQFTQWPATAFADANSPIVIGILGNDPFGAFLEKVVNGETVNGRSIVITRFTQPDQIKTCHVLYVCSNMQDKLSQVLSAVEKKSILTVGDDDDFLKKGGMIRFALKNDKIKVQICPSAVKKADLVVSAKLLAVAEIYKTETN